MVVVFLIVKGLLKDGTISFPIIFKASAGGGGRGMRVVRDEKVTKKKKFTKFYKSKFNFLPKILDYQIRDEKVTKKNRKNAKFTTQKSFAIRA